MSVVNDFSQEGEDFVQRLVHPTRGIRYGRKTGVRTASEVGLRKIRYFRGCDFIDHLEDLATPRGEYSDKRMELLRKKWLGRATSEEIGVMLLKDGYISAAVYRPLDAAKIRKFPDRLVRTPPQKKIERDGYYIINVDERDKYMALKIVILITGILAIVMFPAWPFWAKVGLWYSVVMLLFGLIAAIVARMLLFLLFWVVGVDFWILPNLFDEYVPLSEAFTPVLSIAKNDDDAITVSIRFFFLGLISLSIAEVSRSWTMEDFASPALASMEWGHDKLWDRYHIGSTRAALPSLEEIDALADTIEDTEHEGQP